MRPPFPGMDPFIEGQEWSDFHSAAIQVIRELLVPLVGEHYVVRTERRECILPIPVEKRESFLLIRDRQTLEVVTVLELLSPGNNRPGSDGRAEYLAKRAKVLESSTHLVELDLLRGGARLPTLTPLPPGDFLVIVSRQERRPRADVYGWTLRDPLPKVPVPLRADDLDVMLDLQAVLNTVYERARYDRSLNYSAELSPPVSDDDAQWVRETCGQSGP